MAEIIKRYVDRHYDPKATPTLVKRISYEETRRLQPYYEYLDLDKQALIRINDQPSGLRNIGNTCYLSIFLQLLYHVNEVRDMFLDSTFHKERLLMSIQNLFGQMVFSKFSFCDAEDVFNEFNKVSANKVDSGVQFDFHEYLSVQLDNIELSLKREGLGSKSNSLNRVFCGKYRQVLTAGGEVSVSENKFGMITLNGSMGSFEAAFEAFRNYSVQGYKTKKGDVVPAQIKTEIVEFPPLLSFFINRVTIVDGNLVKNNNEFLYPKALQVDTSNNSFIYSLSEEDSLLQKKITKLEEIMTKKDYKRVLESLKMSLWFLQNQSYETVDNATLDLEGVDNHFGVIGSEEKHQSAKSVLDQYIKKLESQEERLAKTLQSLSLQKKSSYEKKKLLSYSLLALMIHQGNAVSGHYYILIYSQDQRRWRKYNDKIVTDVTEEEVELIASGRFHKETNVCCIIYKHPTFKCNPFLKPPVPASLKNRVMQADNKTADLINETRVERMIRTCVGIAEEEVEVYKEQFNLKTDMFIQYFAEPVNYFIQTNNLRMAELNRLKALLSEQSFLNEVAIQLSLKSFELPDIPIIASKDYVQCKTSIAKALCLERTKDIEAAIATLCYFKPTEPNVNAFYQDVVVLFLLKGTFYIDLFMQTNKKFGLLIECINHGLIYLKKSILTSQVSLNIRSSVDNAGNFIREKLDIHKVAMSKNIPNEGISMKAVFHERFEPWIKIHETLRSTQKPISQEDRMAIEMPLLIEYAKPSK